MLNNLSDNKRSYVQLAFMIFISIITQIILLIRTSFIASEFGAGIEVDAFNFSNSIGTFIFSFIGAGVTTVLIPNLLGDKNHKSISKFISILYSVAFIILLIVYFNRGIIVRILSDGSEQFVKIASGVMLITLITQFINSFTGTTNAIYQCHGNYNKPKLINLFTGILLIILLILWDKINIYTYVFLIFITTLINIILQMVFIPNDKYKYKYILNINDDETKNMFRVFFPTALSTGIYQLSLITDTLIASNLGEGNISILSYSNTIMNMINTVLLTNLMTYFYPKIAKSIDKEDSQKKLFDLSIVLIFIMCFIIVGFYILGEDGIILLFERGKFDSNNTKIVFICSAIYMVSLPVNAVRDLIYRYFYAKQDTLTPFKNSLLISILNILISIILSKYFGLIGIILGTVITSFLSLLMILIRFHRIFSFKYSKKIFIIEITKILIATIGSIIFISKLKFIFPSLSPIINILLYGSLISFVYLLLNFLLKGRVYKVKL